MDDDKNKERVPTERLVHILMGSIISVTSLQANRIPLRDAKIALRVATFMVEELWRKNPKDDVELEQLGHDLSPTMLEMIEAEIAAEPQT